MRGTRWAVVAAALALGLLVAACGTDEPAADAPEEQPAEEPAEDVTEDDETPDTEEPGVEEPEAPEPEPGAAQVTVAEVDLGTVLTDADGMTLYLFTNDTAGESTCYDDCADNWPPLTTDGEPTAGEGVDEELLGTTEREDGTEQVTYNEHPLYHFAGDTAAGDVNGQEVGDVWYVVSPDGEPIENG